MKPILQEAKMKQTVLFRSLVAAGVVALAAGGLTAASPALVHAYAVPQASAASTAVSRTSAALPDFSPIVAQNGPAVVNISVTGMAAQTNDMAPSLGNMDPNDPF